MLVAHGSYTGDGTSGRAITGVGFAPQGVLDKGENAQHAVLALSTFATGKVKLASNNTALATGYINSLDANGFTVSSSVAVNANGVVFHWVAWKAEAADSQILTYTGDGNATQVVTLAVDVATPGGVVWVAPDAASFVHYRHTSETGDLARTFGSGGTITGAVTALGTTSITVGGALNTTGVTYHVLAFAVSANVKVGSFAGNSTDNRVIAAGIVPVYEHLGRIASSSGSQFRYETQAADASFIGNTSGVALTNHIQDEDATDGFQVGTDATVNATSSTYRWWAWKDKADVVAPTVTAKSPTTGATGVALGVTPTLTFSEQMQQAAVEAAAKIYLGAAFSGTEVASTKSYNPATLTVTITPTSLLAATTQYTYGVGTGALDTAGNALASAQSASFTTGGADTTPPAISAISGGATGIATALYTWTTDKIGTTEYRLTTADPGSNYQGADLASTVAHPTPADTAPKVTSHTVNLTGLTGNTPYWLQFRSTNSDGYTSNWTDDVTFTTSNANSTVVTGLELHATYNSMGYEVHYTDDADDSVTADEFTVTSTVAKAAAVTSLTVTALPHPVYDKSLLMFAGGVQVTVNGDHAAGATTLTILSLPAPGLVAGATAMGTAIRFKRSADTNWRYALPTSPTYLPGNKSVVGSLLLLDSDTTYDLHITLKDAAGVTVPVALPLTRNDVTAGNAVGAVGATYGTILATNVATKPDAADAWHNVDPTTLTPTYYVRTDGSDSNGGTANTSGGAWATPEKMVQFLNALAPGSPVVVRFGAGYFVAPVTVLYNSSDRQVTICATNRAAADDGAAANAGTHTIWESRVNISGPSGATEPEVTVAPWTSVNIAGEHGSTYQYWKWTGAASPTVPGFLGIAADRVTPPDTVASWSGFPGATTLGRIAEMIRTNSNPGGTYRFGWFVFGSDVYVRLPGDVDPNTKYVHLGVGIGLLIAGKNVRVSGIEFRALGQGIEIGTDVVRDAAVDHCHFHGTRYQLLIRGNKAAGLYPKGIVLQHNRLTHNLFYHTDGSGPTWSFIKGSTVDAWGAITMGKANEGTGVYGSGGGWRVVIRHNLIDGSFNGLGGNNSGYSRYAMRDYDVHDNTIIRSIDDAQEPEVIFTNYRAWLNRIEKCITFISLAPANYGPLYLFRNTIFDLTQAGLGQDENGGVENVGGAPGGKGHKFENSAAGTAPLVLHEYHNTFWWDWPGISGGKGQSGGAIAFRWRVRNNVYRATQHILSVQNAPFNLLEDHNAFATSDQTRGIEYGGTTRATMTAYRAASGQGVGSNPWTDSVRDTATLDAAFVSAATGDFTPTATSLLRNVGTFIPNISDQPNQFVGTAPDMGATEQGTVDSTAPTITVGPTLGTPTQTSVSATWTLSEPGTGRFKVWVTAAGEGTATYFDDNLTSLSHTIAATGLTANTGHTYRVVGADAAGNAYTSGTATFTTAATPDATAPVVSSLVAVPTGPTGATVTWATDELASTLLRYRVVGAPAWITLAETDTSPRVLAHTVTLSGLVEDTDYEVQVAGTDAAANTSAFSSSATFSTPEDTTPPTPIGGVLTVESIVYTVEFESADEALGNFEYGVGAAFDLTTTPDVDPTTTHTGTLTLTPGLVYRVRYIGHLSDNTEVRSATRTINTVSANGRAKQRGGLLRY